jgi:low affinity Fe/Cu permease
MAIQPIDLQALFSQIDKVGKTQSELKDGLQLQQALQGAASQRKLDERIRSVNETQDSGDGAERIRDRNPRRRHKRGSDEKENAEEKETDATKDAEKSEIVRDPALGHNIDLSG